jgi:hypothetical protein
MARRKKSSSFEDIIELVAMLPWWAGVVLALVFYLWLHSVATQPIAPPPTDLKQLGASVGNQLWHTIATFLQYIIPLACLIGAGVSAYQRHKQHKPQHDWSNSPTRREKYPSDIGVARTPSESAPDCPQCGAQMVKRMAKKGSRAGDAFWGCSTYPGCRGTKAASE